MMRGGWLDVKEGEMDTYVRDKRDKGIKEIKKRHEDRGDQHEAR